MWRVAVILILCLAGLAGCTQSSDSHPGPAAIHAGPPPSDYAFVGSVEGTDSKNVRVGTNPDVIGDSKGDGRLTAFFGIEFWSALQDAKSGRSNGGGSGAAVADPIRIDPQAGKDALKVAVGDLAARFPDRSDVKGYLVRSPAGSYLLYTVFNSDGDLCALYYDVSSWAEAMKNAY